MIHRAIFLNACQLHGSSIKCSKIYGNWFCFSSRFCVSFDIGLQSNTETCVLGGKMFAALSPLSALKCCAAFRFSSVAPEKAFRMNWCTETQKRHRERERFKRILKIISFCSRCAFASELSLQSDARGNKFSFNPSSAGEKNYQN